MCDLQKSILEYCRSNNQNIEETNGFDLQAGVSWIYPTNYPLRDYQFNIIQQALYKNTLVSLPTGLGKTFIAAVVMYNFYRWYPTGKIIFMAPTKPLVKQQIDACYNIMAIPQNVTAELTGMKQNSTRNNIWMEKRVFFVTPQVLQNDLTSFPDLGVSIKCIVFDEAHKARGNYAYCEVIRILRCQTQYFRVLALSATPGNGTDDIGEVIKNLMISHLEFRNEESPDVKPFVFRRKLETIVIPLGEKLNEVKTEFSQILEKYTRNLMKYQIIQGNYSTLTKGRIFMAKAEYQKRSVRPSNYNEVMRDLNICMSLYHANELLIRHGLRGFLSFLDQHADHVLLRGIVQLIKLREKLREYLGPLPNVDPMPDGSHPEVPLSVKFGHPKYYKLRDILISHFTNSEDKSKVIVFFEYRDSVIEAFIILLQARPLIRAKIFLGQKFGITQRIQLNVIKSFRDGDCNTLLSTCIGEEGLDVGEVDLIVCFDVSTKSPIRMVQRMGRTGRKREGQVIILVTEGKEQQTLNECLIHKNNLKNWAGSSRLFERFFMRSPRMVPENIDPHCMKMHITVEKPVITKKSTIKEMLRTISSNSSASPTLLEDVETIEIKEKIPEPIMLFSKSLSEIANFNFEPPYNKYIENQRSLQCGEKIKSSDDSNMFVSLMKFADSRRFNIPLTQNVDKEYCNKNLRQGDIRSMFTKTTNKNYFVLPQDDFITQKCQSSTSTATQNFIHTQSSNQEPKLDELYKELHLEISNYLSIELTMNRRCDICDILFQCSIHNKTYDDKFLEDLKHWIPPDLNRIKRITLKDLESYEKTLCTEPALEENNLDNSIFDLLDGHDISNIISGASMDKKNLKDKSFTFSAPKSFNNLLDTFNISTTCQTKEQLEVEKMDNTQKLMELLSFFKLDRIEDIYEPHEDLNNSLESNKTIICVDSDPPKDIFENYQLSPVLGTQKSPRRDSSEEIEAFSPVLKTCKQIHAVIDKPKDRRSLDIIDTSIEENTNFTKKKLFLSQLIKPDLQKSIASSYTKLANINCDELNESKEYSEDENLLGYFGSKNKRKLLNISKHAAKSLAIGDLCDLSAFGLTAQEEFCEHKISKNSSEVADSHTKNSEFLKKTDDIFDTSVMSSAETTMIEGRSNKLNSIGQHNINSTSHTNETSSNKRKSNISIDDFCDLSVFGLTQKDKDGDLKDNFVEQNSQVRKPDLSNTKNLEMNDSEFDGFLNDLENKHMSTQRKLIGTQVYDNIKTLDIQSTPQIRRTESLCLKSSKARYNDFVETVIVEDSPVKNDILDLTQSPKKTKQKVVSQLSITQIISLAAKPTKSSQHTQPNNNLNETNLNICDISENFESFSKKFDNVTCSSNEVVPEKSNPIGTSQHTSQSNKKREAPQNLSIMDDLHNFEEFNDSFSIKRPSQVFKKPGLKRSSTTKALVEHKKSISKGKTLPSSSKLSTVRLGVDSDDEFEEPANMSIFTLAKTRRTVLRNDSDDEFETTVYPSKIMKKSTTMSVQPVKKTKGKIKKQSKMQCDFIEKEAEVSMDTILISDDEISEDGSFEESFVDDAAQNLVNDTQMQAKYLQSVRSPENNGKFKLPANIRPITSDIFSQAIDTGEQNSYVYDSFCVRTQDIGTEACDLSELEILENKLKERKKSKRKASKSDDNKNIKRRKNIILDSDSE